STVSFVPRRRSSDLFGFWNVWPSYRILLYPFWIKPVVFVASWIKEFTILSGGRRAAMAIRWGLGRSPLDGLAARRLGGVAPYPRPALRAEHRRMGRDSPLKSAESCLF